MYIYICAAYCVLPCVSWLDGCWNAEHTHSLRVARNTQQLASNRQSHSPIFIFVGTLQFYFVVPSLRLT